MRFHLIADATFEAENIDDALARLAAHFQHTADRGLDDDQQLFDGGQVNITKCPENDGRSNQTTLQAPDRG